MYAGAAGLVALGSCQLCHIQSGGPSFLGLCFPHVEVENMGSYLPSPNFLGRRPGRKSPLSPKVLVILDRFTCQKTERPISAKASGTGLRAWHGALVTSLPEQVGGVKGGQGGEWDGF